MEIIRHIKVDLYGDTQHFAVAAKQMDMGTRYIGVTLMEDGVVYEIPDNVEVMVFISIQVMRNKTPAIRKPFLWRMTNAPACCTFSFTVLAAFPVLDAAWAVFPAV